MTILCMEIQEVLKISAVTIKCISFLNCGIHHTQCVLCVFYSSSRSYIRTFVKNIFHILIKIHKKIKVHVFPNICSQRYIIF